MDTLPFENKNLQVLVKKESITDEKYGCSPDKRDAQTIIKYGVVNINKPKGPTSHMVSEYVQKILKIDKAGHSGTLDPGVTGVLPVALERATRVVQALLNAGKEYVCVMHIHKQVPEEEVRKTINTFVGKIIQLPPVRCAVVRQFRERAIYYLDIIEIKEQDILFRVGCQAGTYIRKLCHDIGYKLKVGAHMAELIRTKAGPFSFDTTTTLQDLEDAIWYFKEQKNDKFLKKIIQPIENAVAHLPKIWILDSAVDTICHGANLNAPGVSKLDLDIEIETEVAIMSLKNELVALANAKKTAQQILKETKGVVATPSKVFMMPGTYPKQTN